MPDEARGYQSWSSCEECGFQGLFEFRKRWDEDYEDPGALGVMLDATCPACGHHQAVLVVIDEFDAMKRDASRLDEGED